MDRVEKIGKLEFSNEVTYFAWSPDGTKFAVSISPNEIYIVDSQVFSEIYKIQGRYVAFSYDGRIFETGGVQYDLTSGERITRLNVTLRAYPGYLEEVEFSPNGEYVLGVGSEFIHFFSMKSGLYSYIFTRVGAQPGHGSISPDGKIIAVNYRWEDYTEIWDAYQRKPMRILKMEGISAVGKPRFSSNGESVFLTGYGEWEDGQASFIQEWEYLTGKPMDVQILPEIGGSAKMTMDVSPVSTIAVFGTIEGSVYLLPLHDCEGIKIGSNTEGTSVGVVAFHPDGKIIATVGNRDDTTIELWGIPSREKKPTVESDIPQKMDCPKIPMIVEQPTPKFEVLVR
jgi:WD40 repeat protein